MLLCFEQQQQGAGGRDEDGMGAFGLERHQKACVFTFGKSRLGIRAPSCYSLEKREGSVGRSRGKS